MIHSYLLSTMCPIIVFSFKISNHTLCWILIFFSRTCFFLLFRYLSHFSQKLYLFFSISFLFFYGKPHFSSDILYKIHFVKSYFIYFFHKTFDFPRNFQSLFSLYSKCFTIFSQSKNGGSAGFLPQNRRSHARLPYSLTRIFSTSAMYRVW